MYSHTVHYRPSYCPAVQQLLFLRLMMFSLVALFDYSSQNFFFFYVVFIFVVSRGKVSQNLVSIMSFLRNGELYVVGEDCSSFECHMKTSNLELCRKKNMFHCIYFVLDRK